MHGLSRTSLNIIIVVCLIVISWIHLSGDDADETLLEPLQQPALYDPHWQSWPNAEQVTVLLRRGGTTAGGRVVLRNASGHRHFDLPADNWTIPLQQQLTGLHQALPGVILVSGPWSDLEQQAIAALLIRELQIQPLPPSSELWPACLSNHLPGALWLAQQAGLSWQTLKQLPQALAQQAPPLLPGQQQWADWRLQQSRTLRRHWQDDGTQIDIQADLAYHRLPENAYRSVYDALADAQKSDVAAALSCLAPDVQESHE